METNARRYLSVKDVAATLGVSQSLVYAWIAEGRLRHRRFGQQGRRGVIRVEPDDVKMFSDGCCSELED